MVRGKNLHEVYIECTVKKEKLKSFKFSISIHKQKCDSK